MRACPTTYICIGFHYYSTREFLWFIAANCKGGVSDYLALVFGNGDCSCWYENRYERIKTYWKVCFFSDYRGNSVCCCVRCQYSIYINPLGVFGVLDKNINFL